MEALDTLEGLLLERYNMRAPDRSPLFEAIDLVRESGSAEAIGILHEEIAKREMYRWAPAIDEALRQVEPTTVKQEAAGERQKRVGRGKPDLQAEELKR